MRPGARTDVGPPLRFLSSGPRLGFGAWALGGTGWGATSAEGDRLAAVHRALELGITFFDTAPSYGDGASESLLGRALKGGRLTQAFRKPCQAGESLTRWVPRR